MAAAARFSERLENSFSQLVGFDEEGWESVLESDPLHWFRRVKSNSVLLRGTAKAKVSIDQALCALSPETIAEDASFLKREYFDKAATELQSFGPGDGIHRIQTKSAVGQVFMSLDSSRLKKAQGDADKASSFVLRTVTRRDFPRRGAVSVVMVELEESWQVRDWLVFGAVFERSPDGVGTMIHHVYEADRLDMDILRPLVGQFDAFTADEIKDLEAAGDTMYDEVKAKSGFMVVSLRKCCRGPPLVPSLPAQGCPVLPADGGDIDAFVNALSWSAIEDTSDFNFSDYLKELLMVCRMDPSVVFSSLDGRRLKFFQAAVKRSVWPDISETLQPMLKKQSQVYRMTHGGSGAPHVQADAAPRFADVADPCVAPQSIFEDDTTYLESDDPPWAWHVQVKNTFLQFDSSVTESEAAAAAASLP